MLLIVSLVVVVVMVLFFEWRRTWYGREISVLGVLTTFKFEYLKISIERLFNMML